MLDAICTFAQDDLKMYSIFAFKLLPDAEIDRLRYSLICPVCKQKAYFRKASRDGKQACFGSRYHQIDCSEFNPSMRKSEEEKQIAEVEKILLEKDALLIDFNQAIVHRKKGTLTVVDEGLKPLIVSKGVTQKGPAETLVDPDNGQLHAVTQGLGKLLTSLLRGSSLATSDLWIYTSATHKWRAKNLFVNIADAQPTDNGAPRMYWGTISHADSALNWLNPAEDRSVGIPVAKYRDQLLRRFALEDLSDVEGAGIILFGKCVVSKDKKRKYIYLWGNDLKYLYLSAAPEA